MMEAYTFKITEKEPCDVLKDCEGDRTEESCTHNNDSSVWYCSARRTHIKCQIRLAIVAVASERSFTWYCK